MFFKQVTLMRSTLIALSAMTFGMHNAAAMSSAAPSDGSTSSSKSSSSLSTASQMTRSNLEILETLTHKSPKAPTTAPAKATSAQQMQTVPAAPNVSDPKTPMTNVLRRQLIACTTEETANTQGATKHKQALSADQLENLIRLTFRDANIIQLGAPAILAALKRTDRHNWHLARLTILSAILRFTHVKTGGWNIETRFPFQYVSPNYFRTAFAPTFVAVALAEAINKRLWKMVSDLLRNEYVLFYLDVGIINTLLIVAIDCDQGWLLRRIVNSPITGPLITAETYNSILSKGILGRDVLTICQSPYFKAAMQQEALQQKKAAEEKASAKKALATWTADDLIAWLNDDARPLSPEMQKWFAYKKVQESIRDMFKNHPNWYRDVDSFATLLDEICFFVFLKEKKLTKPNATLKLSEEEMAIAQKLFADLKESANNA